jgi:hypothetical protein
MSLKQTGGSRNDNMIPRSFRLALLFWGVVGGGGPFVMAVSPVVVAEDDGWRSLTHSERIHSPESGADAPVRSDTGWIVEGKPGSFRHDDGRPVWRMEGDEIILDGVGYGFLRYSSRQFDDFIFSMEVHLGRGSNTGVGFRAPPFDQSMPRATRPSIASYELQLQDDHGLDPSVGSSGALYGVFPPSSNPINRAGSWNTVEIACRGPRITITINGSIVQDFDETDHSDLRGKPRSGFLTLQNHGGMVRFRNLRVHHWADALGAADQAHPGSHVVTVDSADDFIRALAGAGRPQHALECVRLGVNVEVAQPVKLGHRKQPLMIFGNGHSIRFTSSGQLRLDGPAHAAVVIDGVVLTSTPEAGKTRLPMIDVQSDRSVRLRRVRSSGLGRRILRVRQGETSGLLEECLLVHAPVTIGAGGIWRFERCTFVSLPGQAAIEAVRGEGQTLIARDCVFAGRDAYGAFRLWDNADATLDHCLLVEEGPHAMKAAGHGRQRQCWFVDPGFPERLFGEGDTYPQKSFRVTNPVLARAAMGGGPLAGCGQFKPLYPFDVVDSSSIALQPKSPVGHLSHRLAHASQPALGIPDLESSLEQRWTREDYIAAYKHAYDQQAWDTALRSFKEKGMAIGRFWWAELEPVAHMFVLTGNNAYLETVRAFLLHECETPSGDGGFTLSRVALCYGLVKSALSAAECALAEACLADHADRCLALESGTEMNRGILNALGLARACNLLPDHPHRGTWEQAHRRFWREGLLRIRDTNEDSTHYNALWLYNVMQYVEAAGIDEQSFYAQPWVREIFERHLLIRDPIGLEPATTGGQPSVTAPAIMEWAGAIYSDGRFRWVGQRAFNFLRAQHGCGNVVPREPMFVHIDDTVPPVPPRPASFVSSRRYDRDFPDKLLLRSGSGTGATAVFINLFNGGGHGLADGSAVYSLVDGLSPSLTGAVRTTPWDAFSNVVQVRRTGEEFPFGSTWRPDQWRRTWVNLRAGNTATGGINIDLDSIRGLGLRCEEAGGGTITLKNLAVTGTTRRQLLAGPVELPVRKWVAFPVPERLSLAGYESLEFEWKYSHDTVPTDISVFASSSDPTPATSRWYSFLLDTWRESRVLLLGDFAGISMVSVEVDLHDHAGGDHRQTRDLFLIPGELVWVRDRVQLKSQEPLQVGPLWHVRHVDRRGDDWAQTRTPSTKWAPRRLPTGGTSGWVEGGPPSSLLVVLPRRPGRDNGHVLDAADTSGRPHCLFQRWQGQATSGTPLSFNSCLLLRADAGDPVAVRKRIEVVHDDDTAAILRFGDWILVDNPDGGVIHQAGIVTDYRLLAVRRAEAGRVSASGLGGTMLEVDGVPVTVANP